MAAEMVFSGLLSGLSPPEAAALLSSLVFQEKSGVEPELSEALGCAYEQLVALTRQVAQVMRGR